MIATILAAAVQVYQAPSPEPTPEETLVLELINRFRADPGAEALRMAPTDGSPRLEGYLPDNVDLNMFREETKALSPAPPLVFNLKLLEAARNHSHYMILNQLTHVEEKGRPGFTGVDMGDRVRAVGYEPGAMGENCYRDADSILSSHIGFVVDYGPGGAGGMQRGRGHRTNMANPDFREVGPGALPHGQSFSVTHNFAAGGGKRMAGGVVYLDKNGNKFYDPGEGIGGVTISAGEGGPRTTTWPSGAYRLELADAKAVTLIASGPDGRTSRAFPAGEQNVKFDWIVPPQQIRERAEKLIAAVEAIEETPGNADRRNRARINLYFQLKPMMEVLEDSTVARAMELIAGLDEQVEPPMQAVRDALQKADARAVEKAIADAKKILRGTDAEKWLDDAGRYQKLSAKVEALRKSAKAGPKEAAAAAAEIDKQEKSFVTDEFKAKVRALRAALVAPAR